MVLPETIKFVRLKPIPHSGIFSQMLFLLSFSSPLCSLTVSTPRGKDFLLQHPHSPWGTGDGPCTPSSAPCKPCAQPGRAQLCCTNLLQRGQHRSCPHKSLCPQPHSSISPSLAARSPRAAPAPAALCQRMCALGEKWANTHCSAT